MRLYNFNSTLDSYPSYLIPTYAGGQCVRVGGAEVGAAACFLDRDCGDRGDAGGSDLWYVRFLDVNCVLSV